MDTMNLTGASASRPLPKWLPQVGGLFAAGTVAFFVCRLPVLHTLSTGEVIGSAVGWVLEVLAASAVTVWVLSVIVSRTAIIDTPRSILRTSLDALWLAPLALFVRENSPWAMLMAVALVATAVRSFRSLQDSVPAGEDARPTSPDGTISLPQVPAQFWRQFASASAALCAQTGALAGFGGYPLTASMLVGTSSAVWTWSFTRYDQREKRHLPSSSSSSLLILALTIIFTLGGLVGYLPHTFWIRGVGVPSRVHVQRGFPQGDRRTEARARSFEGSAPDDKSDPGIILTPDRLTRTTLVAPTPALGNGLLTSHRIADPLVVPFDGVYWFFKAPDEHPPQRSRKAHGSPELLNIHSTDRRPLSMEAHDHLGTLIDLDCCSKIQVAIRNADPYSDTVSLELVLINSALPGKPSQSLGRVMVRSKRAWKLYDEQPPPTHETLNFAVPANPAIRRFDEVKIVFRLDAFRADDGARIAIDRFVLVPRGL